MRPAADVRSGGRTFRAPLPWSVDQLRVFLGRRRRSSPLTLLFGAYAVFSGVLTLTASL